MNPMRKLHRALFVRFLIVATIAALGFGAFAAHAERQRVFQIAADRILVRTAVLVGLLSEQLERRDLSDTETVRKALDVVAHPGFSKESGHYVVGRVLDSGHREVLRITDDEFGRVEQVLSRVEEGIPCPAEEFDRPRFARISIADRTYIHACVPLLDRRGRMAAIGEGVFSTTPDEEVLAFRQLEHAAALAVATVVLSMGLLYPIIRRLFTRLARLSFDLLEANLQTLQVLGNAIAKRDSETDAHNYRVTVYATRIAELMELDDGTIRTLIKGALLHDVGKIGIRDHILLKPGRLDSEEFAEMKNHVAHGLDIVQRCAWLRDACQVVGSHHEKYDGSGYDRGLAGEDIPLTARIFAVADVFDALTSRRPYKEPYSFDEAMGILREGRGRHFDPMVVDSFAAIGRDLYEAYVGRNDEEMRQDYSHILDRYYRGDLTALMA